MSRENTLDERAERLALLLADEWQGEGELSLSRVETASTPATPVRPGSVATGFQALLRLIPWGGLPLRPGRRGEAALPL